METDYRAATVKQRPTSRRITPAEISVRYSMSAHSDDQKVSYFSSIGPDTLYVHSGVQKSKTFLCFTFIKLKNWLYAVLMMV